MKYSASKLGRIEIMGNCRKSLFSIVSKNATITAKFINVAIQKIFIFCLHAFMDCEYTSMVMNIADMICAIPKKAWPMKRK